MVQQKKPAGHRDTKLVVELHMYEAGHREQVRALTLPLPASATTTPPTPPPTPSPNANPWGEENRENGGGESLQPLTPVPARVTTRAAPVPSSPPEGRVIRRMAAFPVSETNR